MMRLSYLATTTSIIIFLTFQAHATATSSTSGGWFTTGGGSTSGSHTTGSHTTGSHTTGSHTTGSHTTGTNTTTGAMTTGAGATTGSFTTGSSTTSGDFTTVTTGTPGTTGDFTTVTTGTPGTTGDFTTVTTGAPGTTGDATTVTTGIPSTTTGGTTGASTTGAPATTGSVTTTTTGQTTGDLTTTTTGLPVTTTTTTTGQATGDQTTTTTGLPTTTTTTTGGATTSTTSQTTSTGETTDNQTTSSTTTGETTGDQTTTTTGDTATTGETPELPAEKPTEREFKSKLEPFFYIDFDWGSWIVNLTPHEPSKKAPQYVKTDFDPKKDTLVYGDFKDGFQKTTYSNIEGGLGLKMSFWYANATGILSQWWAYVGAMPVLGRETESVRYAKTLQEATALEGYKTVPGYATDLDRWSEGDHMTYVSKGGVMFAAGMGVTVFNIGTAALAQGTWETYVEKISAQNIYVKITNGQLENFSTFAGATIVTLSLNKFKNSDDGFSFLYNLSTETGRKAYEDMVRGNVLASAQLAANPPKNMVEIPPVLKVETFKTLTTGRIVSRMFGLPIIWNSTYSTGNIQSFTSSEFHVDQTKAEVNYGIYSREKNYRFWNIHHETDFMFYGARYSVKGMDNSDLTQGMFGRYSYAYKNEASDNNKLRKAIKQLIKTTGIDDLMVNIPTMVLGYTGLDFDVTLSEDNTLRLMDLARRNNEQYFINMGDKYVLAYAKGAGDPYWFCQAGEIQDVRVGCGYRVRQDTVNAMSKVYRALMKMNATQNTDAKAFATAYGQLGEGMGTNLFAFRGVLELAGPGALIEYLVEGTKYSLYYKAWTTTSVPNRWEMTADPRHNADGNNIPFEPRLRRSKSRGFIVSPGTGPIHTPGMPGVGGF